MSHNLAEILASSLNEETIEWFLMGPAERFRSSQQLWSNFIMRGGSYEPQPDPHSPFCFSETPRARCRSQIPATASQGA
jgi:hypothetical protein